MKESTMPDVEFETGSGSAPGYLAAPESGGGPGVIVLQEWWGLEDHIKDVCDRLAKEGFFALAPDLFRGETTDQPDEAQQKMMALSMDQAEHDMRGAVDFLVEQEGVHGPGVGAVGFCLGGGLAVWAATINEKVKAVVSYYYVMPHGKPDFSEIKAPVLGHFGTDDDFVLPGHAKALEREIANASGRPVSFEFYEGAGHAFFNDTNRLGTYDQGAAELSWGRTLDFLRSNLG
ncbi:MAG: dienelactone hydrolase family protein [Thermoleophilaceae bacterium]|nr:dienelactone hydrolase family protein [Thermoleophilaceae bacterium]